eukprot:TRINITY_DN8569_c0_g1_i1.p1 TRINITY_DN8569_c0_g1~~TRINITY_DN8569_c0_g1_i1.p1  ORF type:complete len:216 (-),score=52.49 TRINITY_DN8569_c0_g1_i1:420-1067(-)
MSNKLKVKREGEFEKEDKQTIMIECSEEDFLYLVDVVQSISSFVLKILFWKNWKRNFYLLIGFIFLASSAYLRIDHYITDIILYSLFMYFIIGEKIGEIKTFIKSRIFSRKKQADYKKQLAEQGEDDSREEIMEMDEEEEDFESPIEDKTEEKMPDFVEFDNIKDQVKQKTHQIHALQKKLKKMHNKQIEIDSDQKITSPHHVVNVKFKFKRGEI